MAPFGVILFDLNNTFCTDDQGGETICADAFDTVDLDRSDEPPDLWAALDGLSDHDDYEGCLVDDFEHVVAKHNCEGVDARTLIRGFVEMVNHLVVLLRPGAGATFAAAHDHASAGLATSGPERRQAVKLDALGIADAFDAVVFAGGVSRRKPHPDLFDWTLSDLDVKANTSLHVGDSLEFNMDEARHTGFDTMWCPVKTGDGGDPDPTSYAPAYVLRLLAELSTILDGGP